MAVEVEEVTKESFKTDHKPSN